LSLLVEAWFPAMTVAVSKANVPRL
jgi:hypothetical protein